MKRITRSINLPEGNFEGVLDIFENKDKVILKNIYDKWIELSQELKKVNSTRGVNIPEALSEGAFCLTMGLGRFVKVKVPSKVKTPNTSFDCFSIKTQKRIQVKACSTKSDVTSFGPTSQWDELYFVDFFKDGEWKGNFDIYFIPNHLIYQQKVNKDQTFEQQQAQNRRPRLSIIKNIITPNNIKPIKSSSLR